MIVGKQAVTQQRSVLQQGAYRNMWETTRCRWGEIREGFLEEEMHAEALATGR